MEYGKFIKVSIFLKNKFTNREKYTIISSVRDKLTRLKSDDTT